MTPPGRRSCRSRISSSGSGPTTGTIHAVNGVTFQLEEGERLGLVGESGCGKSVTNLAMIRLLPKPAGRIEGGQVMFDGLDLVTLREAELRTSAAVTSR